MTSPLPESTYREVVEALTAARASLPDDHLIIEKLDAALASLQAVAPAQATLTDDETLLRRALYYLEADYAARNGIDMLESLVAAGDHPVVADLRKRLGGSARFPNVARAAIQAAQGLK